LSGTASNTSTEEYDGSSWTVSAGTLSNGRNLTAGAGTQTAGLCFGGNGPYLAATEEYTRQFNETRNITSS